MHNEKPLRHSDSSLLMACTALHTAAPAVLAARIGIATITQKQSHEFAIVCHGRGVKQYGQSRPTLSNSSVLLRTQKAEARRWRRQSLCSARGQCDAMMPCSYHQRHDKVREGHEDRCDYRPPRVRNEADHHQGNVCHRKATR